MSTVRVLVVDDQELVRDGIASLLGIQPGISVVGTASDGKEAIELALTAAPDVILLDVRMPVMDGVEAVAVLRRRAPACRVVMLTTFDDEEYVVEALKAGASGYLLKNLPAGELANAVRLTHAGVAQFDASVTGHLASALAAAPATRSPSATELTAREIDIVRLVAAGREASPPRVGGRDPLRGAHRMRRPTSRPGRPCTGTSTAGNSTRSPSRSSRWCVNSCGSPQAVTASLAQG
jgi:DNA-binding NarL/FixJ family response regulator